MNFSKVTVSSVLAASTIKPPSSSITEYPLLLSLHIASNQSSTSTSSSSSSAPSIHSSSIPQLANIVDDDDMFAKVRLSESDWDVRIKDKGCMKDALPSNTYMRSHILPIGPHGEERYYYNLTAIPVD